MKRILSIILLLAAGGSALGQSNPGFEQYRQKFWKQMAFSCQVPVKWEKSVEELDEGDGTSKQSKVFLIDCRKGTAVEANSGEEQVLTPTEFAELFKYRYDDPYLVDHLNVVATEGGVTAELLEGEEGAIALQKQAFEVDKATGILRFAEVKVVKSNLLYDFELRTRVWFDEKGRYLRHATETFTKVILSGSVRTLIEGKRLS